MSFRYAGDELVGRVVAVDQPPYRQAGTVERAERGELQPSRAAFGPPPFPAERIAPEEYRAAVTMVLQGGRGYARPALVTEVRSVLGFARTGAALDEAIGLVLDAMLAEGVLGEGSTGVRLR